MRIASALALLAYLATILVGQPLHLEGSPRLKRCEACEGERDEPTGPSREDHHHHSTHNHALCPVCASAHATVAPTGPTIAPADLPVGFASPVAETLPRSGADLPWSARGPPSFI